MFKTLTTSDENKGCVFTPATLDKEISGQECKIRWLSLEFTLRTLLTNMCRLSGTDAIGPELMHFLIFITKSGSPIPASFLLPFENKMLKFQDGYSRIRLANHPRDNYLLIGCFLFSKVIVMRTLFKPYKVARMVNTPPNLVSMTFRENCVVMGYTLVAVLTDVVFECYKDVL